MVVEEIDELLSAITQTDVWMKIVVSSGLLVLLVFLSFITDVDLEKTFIWSFLRGFSQILLMASILLAIFQVDRLWLLYLVLTGMCGFAAITLSRRYQYPHVLRIELVALTTSSLGIMTIVMFSGLIPYFTGIIPYPPTGEYVITMGSTVIANTMAISSVILERIKSDVLKTRGKIEAALSLGATPLQATQSVIHNALRAGLLPTLSTVAVLGIVKIPGWMSGMIVGGISPIEAAVYQVIIYLMLLSSAFLSGVITSSLFIRQFFTKDQQFSVTFLNRLLT